MAAAVRRPPPFARDIAPQNDLVMIYCGARAFELARPLPDRAASLAFPRRADPGAYRWPVAGKHVLVMAGGELQTVTDPLVMELLHQGAYCVSVWAQGELISYDLRERARDSACPA